MDFAVEIAIQQGSWNCLQQDQQLGLEKQLTQKDGCHSVATCWFCIDILKGTK